MRRLIIPAVFLSSWAVGASAQVPVTDVAAISQLIKSTTQEAESYTLQGKQYLNEAMQLQQQVQTYMAFVQNPSLGMAGVVMNQSGLGNNLPINPSGLVGLTSGYSMSLSGLSGKLSQLSSLAGSNYTQNHVYDCTDSSWACVQQKQRAYGIAGSSGVAQAAYQDLRNHMPVVQALRDRAATATTPAEREEVLVALQSEEAWHNNLTGQVEAAKMQADADTASLVQRDKERMSKDIDRTIADIP